MQSNAWYCIDIEASGPVPGLYSMLSLGVTDLVRADDSWVPGESLYLEFQPLDEAGVDPGAMSVHDLSLETLAREGLDPKAGLSRLSEWVEARAQGSKIVFVGHNAPFDWSYISWYYVRFELRNPFGYKALDTKALAMGALGIDWFDTHKDRLAELLPDVPPEDKRVKHRADYDAHYQAQILAALLNRLGL